MSVRTGGRTPCCGWATHTLHGDMVWGCSGISVFGLVAFAKALRGESLFIGAVELHRGVAVGIGLLLQLPLVGYVIVGYVTGALAMLWCGIGVGG